MPPAIERAWVSPMAERGERISIDANVVIGFDPGSIYHDRDKQDVLNDCFNVVATLLP